MTFNRRNFIRTATGAAALAATKGIAWADKGAAGIAATSFAQQIDGFGFSQAFHQARALQNLPEDKRASLLDLMFSPVSAWDTRSCATASATRTPAESPTRAIRCRSSPRREHGTGPAMKTRSG